MGAIQALHSHGKLKEFAFISTVSGGGYPVYGLLDQMIRRNAELHELLDEDGKFIKAVDAQSNFIGSSDIYAGLVLGPTLWAPLSWFPGWYGAARPTYGAKIHRSFTGGLIPFFGTPKLVEASAIQERGFPTPIFGTSASMGKGSPQIGYDYSYSKFFELSPLLSGAPDPEIGYFRGLAQEIEVIDAVAMSAAAIDTPQSYGKGDDLRNLAKALNLGLGGQFTARKEDGGRVHFHLADGGFIENLGILPLLRRGCSDIIAFDNSDDELPFDTWNRLEEKLPKEEGWIIVQGLQAIDGSLPPTMEGAGWKLPHHLWFSQLKKGDRTVTIRLVKLGINSDPKRMPDYPRVVQDFAELQWNGEMPACRDGESPLRRRCSFPLEATVRQSFAPDEFRAYRHLGRWLGELAITASSADFQ